MNNNEMTNESKTDNIPKLNPCGFKKSVDGDSTGEIKLMSVDKFVQPLMETPKPEIK